MATQLDLFENVFKEEDVLLHRIEKMEHDITRMRKSFFVRLEAQEKKFVNLKEELDRIKSIPYHNLEK